MTMKHWVGAGAGALLLAMAQLAGAGDPPAAQPAEASASADAGGTGTVIFFRPKKFAGGAVGFKVREGEKVLGKLRSGNYFVVHVAPGKHEYTVHSESKDVLAMEVDAGETYYVQGTISVGIMVGRPNLAPSDAATFEGMKDKLKDVTGQLSKEDTEGKD